VRLTLGIAALHQRARKVRDVQPLAAVLHAQAHIRSVVAALANLDPDIACKQSMKSTLLQAQLTTAGCGIVLAHASYQ
jgi:hypothetical protein